MAQHPRWVGANGASLTPGLESAPVSKVQPNGDTCAFNLNLVPELAPLRLGEEKQHARSWQGGARLNASARPRVLKALVFKLVESTSLPTFWFQMSNLKARVFQLVESTSLSTFLVSKCQPAPPTYVTAWSFFSPDQSSLWMRRAGRARGGFYTIHVV